MLIYNSQKEFIGIDEKDLKILGFNNLSLLRAEVADFADLFVKTPGYIHNFKHVHWIDFISCADSAEESKVIINVNNKSFKCRVSIENIFLTDNASSKAYIVYLNNLRELNVKESEGISGDIAARPTPKAAPAFIAPEVVDAFDDTTYEEEFQAPVVQEDPYESPLEVDFDDEDLDFEEEMQAQEEESYLAPKIEDDNDMLDVGDLSFDEEIEAPTELVNENYDNGYTYDPYLASSELGLPLDLIEEFIQDFIAQAKEFKGDIYTALDLGEFDKVKILSHKLKGVAANLRIEDALDTLNVVNTASDSYIIREHLDTFYKIIAKLSGEEVAVEKPLIAEKVVEAPKAVEVQTVEKEEEDDDDDLYEDLLYIEDSQVPDKIEIPELADDNFLTIDEIEGTELLKIEEEYSKESIAAQIGLDMESFNELFEEYVIESKSIIAKMKNAVENNDFTIVKHAATKLKDMNANMKIDSFTQALMILTNSIDKDEIGKAIDDIENGISKISAIGA